MGATVASILHSAGSGTVEELKHYGKKGMKWGVRREAVSVARKSLDKKTLKADQKWEKKNYTTKNYWKVYNNSAKRMNSVEIPKINAKYHGKDISKGAAQKKYNQEMADAFTKTLREELASVYSQAGLSSPSGTLRVNVSYDNEVGWPVWAIEEQNS